MTTFYRTMRTLNLDVTTIVPVHGRPAPMAAFIKAMGSAATECPGPGAGGSVAWGPCR
jgi:hypothetical protein